ncbi:MAG: hypothetical protein ABJP48_00855 [Erythrobacter sp.]
MSNIVFNSSLGRSPALLFSGRFPNRKSDNHFFWKTPRSPALLLSGRFPNRKSDSHFFWETPRSARAELNAKNAGERNLVGQRAEFS